MYTEAKVGGNRKVLCNPSVMTLSTNKLQHESFCFQVHIITVIPLSFQQQYNPYYKWVTS